MEQSSRSSVIYFQVCRAGSVPWVLKLLYLELVAYVHFAGTLLTAAKAVM